MSTAEDTRIDTTLASDLRPPCEAGGELPDDPACPSPAAWWLKVLEPDCCPPVNEGPQIVLLCERHFHGLREGDLGQCSGCGTWLRIWPTWVVDYGRIGQGPA